MPLNLFQQRQWLSQNYSNPRGWVPHCALPTRLIHHVKYGKRLSDDRIDRRGNDGNVTFIRIALYVSS